MGVVRSRHSLTHRRNSAAQLARGAALGLAWLHGSDPIFIHRDVKPSNFLIDDALRVKITDFGLSQIRHRGERLIDRAGAVGTPLYMAVEVLNGYVFCVSVVVSIGRSDKLETQRTLHRKVGRVQVSLVGL